MKKSSLLPHQPGRIRGRIGTNQLFLKNFLNFPPSFYSQSSFRSIVAHSESLPCGFSFGRVAGRWSENHKATLVEKENFYRFPKCKQIPLSFFLSFHWSIVALQCCVSFYCIAKWISCTCTYILSLISFPFRSPQSIEQSSPCYTVGSH